MNQFVNSWQLATATASPNHQPSQRLFFFSEILPVGSHNIHHVYAPVVKHGVVLEGDAPWERGGSVASFCSTVLRLDNHCYRLYYTMRNEGSMRIAVAESEDGVVWQRIPLGQETWQGHVTNRLVLTGVPDIEVFDSQHVQPEGKNSRQNQVGQPQVLLLPDGRWRMVYWHHQHGWGRIPYLYTIAESHDGLRWHVPNFDQPALNSHWLGNQTELSEEQRLKEKGRRTNDANFMYWNPRLACYEQYSQWFLDASPERRVDVDNCPDYNRMIQRRVSEDGLVWSAPELVIQADAKDPWDQQFYHLAVQYHEDWLIGSLGHYRVENGQQTMDLELAFSRDGRRWERPLRGGFIPREPNGRDAEGVYPPNAWIDRGDRWLCLYTGTARKHNQHANTELPPNCVMAASWSKNRFVGLRAEHIAGGFLTPVFYPQSPEIHVDADIRGWLRAELCNAWGQKLAGYHLEHSIPIHGDDTTHILRWYDKDTYDYQHDPVRVRFEFVNADIYNIAF